MNMRIGFGYDVHAFAKNRDLIIGGVKIPHEKGLEGHSDADVLLHAITDALLGAAALGDIGTHFPDSDPAYKDADSLQLLSSAYGLIKREGYELINIDATVVAERPTLKKYIPTMRGNISGALQSDIGAISVKATTNEKMGFVGRKEGIAVHAVALLQKSI